MLLAERAHWLSGQAQARPGIDGEQVMLDLAVQATKEEIGEPPAPDVAGGNDLITS